MPALGQDIAPQGDLYILIGQTNEQKLVRVSKAILSAASPVFSALLSPNFKEGNDVNDKSSPLKLPEDDPVATSNLFLMMHWKISDLDETANDWLQRLVVVCDKYGCISKFQHFFKCKIQDSTLTNLDKLHVVAHIGDRERFAEISELLVRLPQSEVKNQLHTDLHTLLPESTLDSLEEYRRKCRIENQQLAQKVECDILKAARGQKLCYGLRERYLAFTTLVYIQGIKTADTTSDAPLPDLNQILTTNLLGSGDKNVDSPECRSWCSCRNIKVKTMITTAMEALTMGQAGNCGLCFDCFLDGVSELQQDCKKHVQPKTDSNPDQPVLVTLGSILSGSGA